MLFRSHLGTTRNAVIGKARRMGLRSKPISKPISKPWPVPVVPMIPHVPNDIGSLMSLRPMDCRWPIGDPKEPGFRFCCERKTEGSSYCEAHRKLAYTPTREVPFTRLYTTSKSTI